MFRPRIYLQILTLLVIGLFNPILATYPSTQVSSKLSMAKNSLLFAKLSPSPSSNWAVAGSIPSFSVNDETLEIFLDLNPIGHGGHLTLF